MANEQCRRFHVADSIFELTQTTVDDLFRCHAASVRRSACLRNVRACEAARSCDANVIRVSRCGWPGDIVARHFTGIALALTAGAMRALTVTFRALLLLAPLTNFAGHARCDADVLKSTAELNRCLTAVRVALTRRGAHEVPTRLAAKRAELRTRPSQQI